MGYGGTAQVSAEIDVDLVQTDVDAIINGIAGAPGSEATLGELATQATLAALDTKAGAMATEMTLAATKARADLLGTEATLLALKNRGDLLATEITLGALNAQAGLLLTEETFDDFALDDELSSPLYGDSCVGRVAMADILNDLHTGEYNNTMDAPLHGTGRIWDEYGWEIDWLGQFSIGEMIANTFTQTGCGMAGGDNILGFGSPLWSYAGCCGARSLAEMMEHLVHNADGYSSPLYYNWSSVAYYIYLMQADIAAIKAVTDKLTFDGSNHLEVHTNA